MLYQVNKQIFDDVKEQWSSTLAGVPEDFPKEGYLRRIDYMDPSRPKIAQTNDYVLKDSDTNQYLATMAISHVGAKSSQAYIKIIELMFSPTILVIGEAPSNFVDTMVKLTIASLRLSDIEMKSKKVKIHGNSKHADIFFEMIVKAHNQISDEGYELALSIGRHGPWLEFTKR